MSSKGPDTTKAAKISADAANRASDISASSEAEARALNDKQFNQQMGYLKEQDAYNQDLTKQNQANYQPYINAGRAGLDQMTAAVNDQSSWLNHTFNQDDLQQDDGYKFRLAQGQQGLNSSLAAGAGLLSGAALKATSQYNQGMASDEYGSAYERFTNDRNNRYSQLNNLTGLGIAGASGFASGSPQSVAGQQMSNIAGQSGQNLQNIAQGGANTRSNILLSNAQQQAQYAMQGGVGPSGFGRFAGGAASGAMMGSAGGPVGMFAGGVIGGLASLL